MKTPENKTEVDVKAVEAELGEIKAFLKQFGKDGQEAFLQVFRNIDSYLDVVLPDRKSHDDLEARVKEVMASEYAEAFALLVTKPELLSKLESELSGQENEDELEFLEFSQVEAFLDGASDHEKVLFVLCQGLSLAQNNGNSSAGEYLVALWERFSDKYNRDVKDMFDDPGIGKIALTGHLLVALNTT